MNKFKLLDIILTIVGIYFLLISDMLGGVVFFIIGLLHLYQAATEERTSSNHKLNLWVGMFLVVTTFSWFSSQSYIKQSLQKSYEHNESSRHSE
jgi:membrane-bound ClpP family serine protease